MRTIACICALFSGVLVTVAGEARQITFPCTGEINTENANLRAGKSLNYETMAKLDQGTRVTVSGYVSGWYRIVPPKNVPFWVSRRFLSDGRVTAGRLNVRAKPVLTSTVVCQLQREESVEAMEERDEWTAIRAPRCASLWISSELVDLLPDERGVEKPPEKAVSEEEEERESPESVEGEEAAAKEQPEATAPVAMKAGAFGSALRVKMATSCAYEGTLMLCEEVVVPGVRYKLVKGFLISRTVCLVGSRSINLAYYSGDRVKVWGYEVSRLSTGVPVVDVRRLEPE
ncbi:MAG: SH3 domain-containing protein [Candidatus Aureabacteria bacterium]|nr:SH3 domain-containing protein [Candidatus Auribacterota bacterium]